MTYILIVSVLLLVFLVLIEMMIEDLLQFVEFFKKKLVLISFISPKKGVIAYLDNFIIIGITGAYLGLAITKAIAPRIAKKRKVKFSSIFLRTNEMKVNGIKVIIKCGRFIIPHKELGYLEFQSKYVFVHAYNFKERDDFINFLKRIEMLIEPC